MEDRYHKEYSLFFEISEANVKPPSVLNFMKLSNESNTTTNLSVDVLN